MAPDAMTPAQWCEKILTRLAERGPEAGILDVESNALLFALAGPDGPGLYMVSVGNDAQLECGTTTPVLACDLDMAEDLADPNSYARRMAGSPSYLMLTRAELAWLKNAIGAS